MASLSPAIRRRTPHKRRGVVNRTVEEAELLNAGPTPLEGTETWGPAQPQGPAVMCVGAEDLQALR
jgi:hypothetical protein